MKNIVTEPTKELQSFTIKFKADGVPVELNFFANIAEDEMSAVLDNWFPRAKKLTSESLVDYINSKAHYGFRAKLPKDIVIENQCTGRKIENPDFKYFTAFKNSVLDGTWKIKE